MYILSSEIVYERTADFLPTIPEYFILTEPDEIKSGVSIHPYPSETYSSWTIAGITDELELFLQPYFKFEIQARYQILTGNIPIHSDVGRQFAYNYLLVSDDNIATRWWDDDHNLLHSTVFKKRKWYWLDVKTLHDIEKVDCRIAITLKRKPRDA